MNFNFDNCNLLVNSESIECEYFFIFNKKVKWEIRLSKDELVYSNYEKEFVLSSSEIKEFWFEVEQGIQRAHNFSQIGIGYVINYKQEPLELFRICAREELKQKSNTKSYEFTEIIIKKLSVFYNKPYTYKNFIDSPIKKNKTYGLIGVVFITIVILILLFKN